MTGLALITVTLLASGDPTPDAPRRSQRSVEELLPESGHDVAMTPGFPVGSDADRPAFLQLRSVGGAAALGGLVGFGAGHYYAGDTPWGVAMSVIDTSLLATFAALTFELHEDIAQNDFVAEASLARGERGMTSGERRLYNGSWAIVVTALLSRAFQAFDAGASATRTNEGLLDLSFVPLGTAPAPGGPRGGEGR